MMLNEDGDGGDGDGGEDGCRVRLGGDGQSCVVVCMSNLRVAR